MYSIRKIQPSDQDFLEEMLYQAVFVPDGEPRPERGIVFEPSLYKYVENYGLETDYGYLAEDEDTKEPIGAVWLRLFTHANKGWGYVDETIPELSMAVLPSCRGQGVGTNLLERIIDETFYRYDAISLSVDPNNPAIHLYKRFGFTECGREGTSIVMRMDR